MKARMGRTVTEQTTIKKGSQMSTVRVTVHKRFMTDDKWEETRNSPKKMREIPGKLLTREDVYKVSGEWKRETMKDKEGEDLVDREILVAYVMAKKEVTDRMIKNQDTKV